MDNEPMPWQLTVGKLRQILQDAPDEAVVALQVPPPGLGHKELVLFCNLQVEYSGGMVVRITPLGAPNVESETGVPA